MGLFNPYDDYSIEDPVWKKVVSFLLDSLASILMLVSPAGVIVGFFGGFIGRDPLLTTCGWVGGLSLAVAVIGFASFVALQLLFLRDSDEVPGWFSRSLLCFGLLFCVSIVSGTISLIYFWANSAQIFH